jgi:hypothetical protein
LIEFILDPGQINRILEGNFSAKIKNLIPDINVINTKALIEQLREVTVLLEGYPSELFFVLDHENESKEVKNFLEKSDEILPELVGSRTLLSIDYFLNIISEKYLTSDVNADDLAKDISNEKGSVVILIAPPELTVYCKGKLIEYVEDSKLDFISKRSRIETQPMEEYADLLKNHHETEVKYSQVCDHWSKKTKRILRNKPESIFRKNLWNYLRTHVYPCKSCDPEFELPTSDKVDIRVLNDNGEYLIEIKWLGRSRRLDSPELTEYDEGRAREGARQTIEYLNIRPGAEKGICVIYDARDKDEEIEWGDDETHPKLDCRRFFLESKPASTKAKV